MPCTKCNSDRVASIMGKCSDRSCMRFKGKEHTGYVIDDVGIGGGDYIEFDYCLEYGQIQSLFPVDDPSFVNEEEDED